MGSETPVIPAKAGIQSVDCLLPKACGVDSSRHGGTGMTATCSAHLSQTTPLPRVRTPSGRSCRRNDFPRTPSKFAAVPAVTEIDGQANNQPHHETHPGFDRQAGHEDKATKDGKDWNDGNPGGAKGTTALRLGAAEHEHAHRHQREGKQRSDIREVRQRANIKDAGRDRHKEARHPGADVRGAKPRMNF